MGAKEFGNLYKIRGIITYSLSPYEQRAFAGAIKKGLPNMIKRIADIAPYLVPPTLLAYMFYLYNVNTHKALQRKNPDDYKDEV
ncbi:hypothetical protein FQA39_LY10309 [Lamprigera yunnana]|nr:hypothetical protein FQA39_LY10309 [Lamprigera yunnana]